MFHRVVPARAVPEGPGPGGRPDPTASARTSIRAGARAAPGPPSRLAEPGGPGA
ncbi:hypothetical protein GCM10009551_020310 [Nocardiopsis tropica]